VYRLLRSNGDVLYVGKAKSLRKRVASHFAKQRGATERALEMLTQVHDVAFEVTATALEAALLESGLIKTLDPPYNIQLVRGARSAWFASLDLRSTSPVPDEQHRLGPLPSRFSVRCLRAVMELVAGEPPTPARRAAATGAPRPFAPDEESFAGGWDRFIQRRAGHLGPPSGDPRILTLGMARDLLLEAHGSDDDQGGAEGGDPADVDDSEVATTPAPRAPAWDPERVCRHLERSLAGAYQVLRRSGWLCVLASSSVSFREPHHGTGRWLRLEDAVVVASATEVTMTAMTEMTAATPTTELTPPTPPPRPARAILQAAFDAARYDQLRILTGELKRIARDGGEVAVRLSRGCVLNGTRLRHILRLV
jgi:predicted GIY-YIG superfamily endonuclease